MGETSGGRSATWPTFSRFTSRRTRIERQYSHVVWTAPDHRNRMAAPQLGQLACWLIGGRKIGPVDSAHADGGGCKLASQIRVEVPLRARPAAKNVEAKRMILRKSVAGKMRFFEQ